MNQRLQELVEQAGFKTETWRDLKGTPTTTIYKEALGGNNLEKFAELLIQECADTAYQSLYEDRVFDDSPHNIRCHVMDAIKQHFGVKE